MPVKKKQKKQEQLPKAIEVVHPGIRKIFRQFEGAYEDLCNRQSEAIDQAFYIKSAKTDLKEAELEWKEAQRDFQGSIKDLDSANANILSSRTKLIKLSQELSKLLEKTPLLPLKKKRKLKKKALGPVIPFVAPDVLESRSEV